MKTASENNNLKKLTLIIGILVAIIAGWSSTALAESKQPANSLMTISHEEMVEALQYLWEESAPDGPHTVSIYNYQFELIYDGAVSKLQEPSLLQRGDLMMRDGNHAIYFIEHCN